MKMIPVPQDELDRLRKIEKYARSYFDDFVRDEADSPECCVSLDQHDAAKLLGNALGRIST